MKPGQKNKKICAVYIEILLLWYFGQKYSSLYFRTIATNIIFVLKRVLKGNRAFFFFVTWFHWLFGHFWWFHEYFLATKFETIGGFMKLGKKINWNFSGGRLGPRASAPASKSFNFFLPSFMNTTYGFQIFLPKIFVNTTKSDQIINEIQVTK